jgi:predicted acylesterase/phospholipase RssA
MLMEQAMKENIKTLGGALLGLVKSAQPDKPTQLHDPSEMHLLISSGGSRAILAGAGAILACHHAGLSNWKSYGGISGGSLPAVMAASGMDARTTVATALDVDFASLLTKRGSMLKIMLAYLLQGRYEKTRPRYGVLSSEKVGTFVESIVGRWPSKYWTMAVSEDTQMVFTATGVHHIEPHRYRLLNTEPAPLGVSIRGSCAVPGIIDAVPIEVATETHWLLDGALSHEGRTPVSVPERFFGAKPSQIVVVDVGDGKDKIAQRKAKRAMRFWRMVCGKLCIPQFSPDPVDPAKGYIVVEPEPTKFGSLKFTLTRDEKWMAVMGGFNAAVDALAAAGYLDGDKLATARRVVDEYRAIEAKTWGIKKIPVGTLSTEVEQSLAAAGLW